MVNNKVNKNLLRSDTLFSIKEWTLICQVDNHWFKWHILFYFEVDDLIVANKYVIEIKGRYFCNIDGKIYLVERRV